MNTAKQNGNETITLAGDWNAQSKDLKTRYTQLTDADLNFEPGKENELISRVQSRLKKNRTEVVQILRSSQVEQK
jgi:hypothetical protein